MWASSVYARIGWNAGLAFLLDSLVSKVDTPVSLSVCRPGAFVFEAVGLLLLLGTFVSTCTPHIPHDVPHGS